MIYSYPVDLYLIDKDTQRRSKLDDIYCMKDDIQRACLTIARMRKTKPDMIPMLEDRWKQVASTLLHRIRRNYYDMLQLIDFDRIVYQELRSRASSQREEYYLVQFDDELLVLLNKLSKPKRLTPPLYYEKGLVSTAHAGSFYARFQKDCFDHETIVIRQAGEEKFFAACKQAHKIAPYYERIPWVEPFLLRGQDDLSFQDWDSSFEETYEILKGLIYFWYDFRF